MNMTVKDTQLPQEELENKAFESITFEKPKEKRKGTQRFHERDLDGRPSISFHTGSRFNVPQEVMDADPEHQYAFIPYVQGGEPCQDVIDEATERGYWPVSKTEHPKLAQRYVNDLYATSNKGDDYVKRGGQIMMRRPKELHEAENSEFLRINQRNEQLSKSMVLFEQQRHGPLQQFWRQGQ
jgi:hypothetical protein